MSGHQFKIDRDSDPEWIIVHDVPILDEHRLIVQADAEKKKPARVVDIDVPMLQRLAANNNRNITETGDWVPLTHGHTTDDGPEHTQPEILGYADQFKVGPLFNSGRNALLARLRISKDPEKLKKAQNLPRRSVELWLDREEVNPISLLGATAPERNLGLLRLKHFGIGQVLMQSNTVRGSDGKVRFRQHTERLRFSQYEEAGTPRIPDGESPMQPSPQMSASPTVDTTCYQPATGEGPQADPNMVQAVVSAVMQSDVMVQMQQTLQQVQSQLQSLTMPQMPGQQQGMGQEDPMMQLMAQLQGGGGGGGGQQQQGGGGEGEKKEERREGEMLPMAAGMGGMGAFIPGQLGTPQQQSVPHTSDKTVLPTMANHTVHMKAGETLEQAVVRLASERDEAVRFARTAVVATELAALQQEGVDLDIREELPDLVALDDNARAVRYQRMRVRYNKRAQQQTQQLPDRPQLPQLRPVVGESNRVPTAAEQANTQTTRQQDAPMTKEERDEVLAVIEQSRQEHERLRKPFNTPAVGDVLKLLRSGQVQRLQRNGTPERVY